MSLSTHRQVRAAIAAVLEAVPGIGRVHQRQVYADREGTLRELYQATLSDGSTQLRGWHLTRISQRETSDGAMNRIESRWAIRGYLALAEERESELELDDLIDAISTAFQADWNLGGVVGGIDVDEESGIQVEDQGPVLFAGVLCHEARLILTTWQATTTNARAIP
jgi:hypothetical protein